MSAGDGLTVAVIIAAEALVLWALLRGLLAVDRWWDRTRSNWHRWDHEGLL